MASLSFTDEEIRHELGDINARLNRIRLLNRESPTWSWKIEYEKRALLRHRKRLTELLNR
jgi:hypothetical protein